MPIKEISEIVTVLRKSLNDMYKLLNNLLIWSRLQRGMIEYNPVNCSPDSLINAILIVNREDAVSKEIAFDLSSDIGISIFCDSFMIESVLRNLISNSIKFSPKGSTVHFSIADYDEDNVLISVRDEGIGMDKEILGKLFKIEEKTYQPGTEGESGSGLGLVLCKEFLKCHSRELSIQSEQNKGTLVSFTLPKYKNEDIKDS